MCKKFIPSLIVVMFEMWEIFNWINFCKQFYFHQFQPSYNLSLITSLLSLKNLHLKQELKYYPYQTYPECLFYLLSAAAQWQQGFSYPLHLCCPLQSSHEDTGIRRRSSWRVARWWWTPSCSSPVTAPWMTQVWIKKNEWKNCSQ